MPKQMEVAKRADSPSSPALMSELAVNCSRSADAGTVSVITGDAVSRIVTFADTDSEMSTSYTVSRDGTLNNPPAPMHISFDMLGIPSITDDMLRDLYDAFDVHQCGGVERSVMREMMCSGFCNYGAPCSEKDIDRLFERITPYSIRRRLKGNNGEEELMSFNEFCALFLSWMRL